MPQSLRKYQAGMIGGLAIVVLIGAVVVYSQTRTRSAAVPSAQMAALNQLRESGVITAEEYQAKVQSLQASGSTAPASSAASAPARFSKVSTGTQRVEVTDPQYQIAAVTMEIPADWKFAGTVVRPAGCHGHGASLKYTAQGPDGLSAVVALPGVAWEWASSETAQKFMAQSHCPAIDIATAASFLVNIAVPNIQPNAKIVAVQPLNAEAQAALKEQREKQIQQNAAMGNFKQVNPKLTLDGANVRIQYERDGHAVEETIGAVVQCNEQTMPAMPLLKEAAYRKRTCFSRATFITRAPRGHLDELLALPQLKFGKTTHVNADWQNRLAADQMAAFQKGMADNQRQYANFEKQLDANNRQAAANLQHFKEQGDARMAQGRAFQDQQTDSFNHAMDADRQRQAAIDASAHATALNSLDRQEFRNPDTGQIIEASNQYNHQWISSDGNTLIQTNDHSFDPNGQVNPVSQSWSELVVK